MATDLIEQVLEDPDNDLGAIADEFRASGESCWHIDRHVITEISEGAQPDAHLLLTACRAALALARKWLEQSSAVRDPGLFVSEIIVILDDAWVTGVIEAPPPHVYICLARDQASFKPVQRRQILQCKSSGNRIVDSLLTGHERIFRSEGAFEGEPGAWILKCDPE